jgi:hypothetical protein
MNKAAFPSARLKNALFYTKRALFAPTWGKTVFSLAGLTGTITGSLGGVVENALSPKKWQSGGSFIAPAKGFGIIKQNIPKSKLRPSGP